MGLRQGYTNLTPHQSKTFNLSPWETEQLSGVKTIQNVLYEKKKISVQLQLS